MTFLLLLAACSDYKLTGPAPEVAEAEATDTGFRPDTDADTDSGADADTDADTGSQTVEDTDTPDTDTPDTDTPDTGTPDTGTPDTGTDFDYVDCASAANALGCTADVGTGRLFLWGDEHVLFSDYRPASDAFWASTLSYLADPDGASPRTTIDIDPGLSAYSSVLTDAAAALGLTVVPGGEILLRRASSYIDVVPADELAAGKAVMLLSVGYGASECAGLSDSTAGLPLTFRCPDEVWGPVGTLAAHPITDALGADAFPFVNGRYVQDLGVQPTALVAQD
jgi:hypothetical protein